MKKVFAVILVLILSFSLVFVEGAAISADNSGVVTASIPEGDVQVGTSVKLDTDDSESDIWYTVDGSDPVNSETAYLYSEDRGIMITHDVTVKACTKSEKSGVGKVEEFKYTCPVGLVADDENWALANVSYAVSLDTENKKVGENSVKLVGASGRYISTGEIAIDSNFDYKLSFWAKTERLGADDLVEFKVFLSGAGSERHPLDSKISGATLGNYGKTFFNFKADQDWTYYEVDINNMLGFIDAITLILFNNSTSGLAWIDGVSLTAVPKAYYPITVNSDGSVYCNIYNQEVSDDYIIEQGLTISNAANNLEKGKLHYEVVNDLEPDVTIQTGEIDVSLESGSEIAEKIKLDSINKYGTFTVSFTMTNSHGAVYNAGEVRLSRLIDNTYLVENGGTYLGACGAINDDEGGRTCNYIGNSLMRFDYDWTAVEKEKGVYSINEKEDNYITAMVENNIEPIVIFNTHGWPEWTEKQAWPTTESDLEHFLGYVKFLVETYKGKVKYFEFYNEVNDRHAGSPEEYPDAAGYTETMKEVYKVLKEANPDAVLLGGATSGMGEGFARIMFENGAADYMDYYSFHPYAQAESPESADWVESLNSLNNTIIETIGKPFPMFITEVGYATARTIARGHSEYNQMTYSLRLYTMAKSVDNLEKIVTYQIGGGNRIYETENQYGMLKSGEYAKPSAIARAAFNYMHDGFKYDSTAELAENLFTYKFAGETEDMYVLWTNDIECYADIVTSDKSAKVYDIFGNLVNAKYKRNEFKAEVGSKIIYIRLNKGETIENVVIKDKTTISEKEKEEYEKYFNGSSFPWIYVIIGTALLLLAAGAVIVVILIRKKKANEKADEQ